MQNVKILWADDEIQHLKSQIMFLEQKGAKVDAVPTGQDAIEAVQKQDYDIVFLDENMPGLSGIETLEKIKAVQPQIPVVMITKSEEENLMEDAIGNQISDYLIKPVNPNQILLSLKKLLEGRQLVSQRVNQGYQRDFRNIGMAVLDTQSTTEWADIYKKLVYWDRQLHQGEDKSMFEVWEAQMAEANVNFTKFVTKNYIKWVNGKSDDKPILSPDLLQAKVFPHLKPGKYSLFFILVDCLRYDQWKEMEDFFAQYFDIETEDTYYALLPTATQYARNAIFSGMYPLEISERYPKYWVSDEEEGGKNLHEADFLQEHIVRKRLNIKHSYTKIITNEEGKQFADNILNYLHNDLNAVVVNFIDLMTHARAEMSLIKELAPDEAGFRSLSRSWIEHSTLLTALRKIKDKNVKIVLTTDHGSIRVKKPLKIVGDRHTTTNLRYKQGRNLNYDEDNRMIFTIRKPEDAKLPKSNVSGSYAFAAEDGYFVYPNNYNYYAAYYKDTFQHGGISLEEMIVPVITLTPKR
jgi:CheY-like chemotaxis protein